MSKSDETIKREMKKIFSEQKLLTLRAIVGMFNTKDENGKRRPGRVFVSPGRVTAVLRENPDVFEVKEMSCDHRKVYGLK